MYRTYKIQIHPQHELFNYCDLLCFKAKNLYNITNYYIRQVYTALRKEIKNENQLQVLIDIETYLPQMNGIRMKSYERAKAKPKKIDKKGKIIEPKLKLFEMPTQERSFISYAFVEALFKVMKQIDYTTMSSQSNQQTMKKVYDDWKSFFEASKKYKINPASFSGKPKIPKYKPKNGRTICYLTNQITEIKDRILKLPGTPLQLNLGKIAHFEGKLQQVRVVPSYGRYVIEIVFKGEQEKEIKRTDKRKNEFVFPPKWVMGIDLGVDNLATIVDNTGHKPLLIKGTGLKSTNQYYNKLRAKYMCILRNGKNPREGRFTTNRLISLDRKRNNRVMDYLHKSSAKVVEIALERNIDTIIIGRNIGWKLEVEMKKANKQTFIQIPHATFIEMIRYKAERKGIQVIDREESYTSKSSFLDRDPIPTFGDDKLPNFSGYRSSRAFYKIKGSKVLIHADVNGAFNIVRKYVKDAFEGLERKRFLQAPEKIIIMEKKHAKLKASA
ncbi:transposase, family protein [Neobacillus bataviensis LMG 21833]|uniref:Transposase, family protein n=1 Tax=Neobacillus bataviensis LMG 21833 TaxID=1117379 RepID=K6D9K2_9BACI|nr:RNA-guided endonuclease TnpB family protein [Neobacillus bataviensis]EKN69207.1 transposase, family protein [Neobacillus bataviensis LMG 21833]